MIWRNNKQVQSLSKQDIKRLVILEGVMTIVRKQITETNDYKNNKEGWK